MKSDQAWQAALGQLQMEMPKAAYDTWVRDTELVTYEDGSFIIGVHNPYARDWLESRLSSTVKRLLSGIMNRTVDVRFIVWQKKGSPSDPQDIPENPTVSNGDQDIGNLHPQTPVDNPTINSRYTFENFVVGASNRLAHAASLAVAENPAQAYNPLFLYGGVGLGKTHLLHAMGGM